MAALLCIVPAGILQAGDDRPAPRTNLQLFQQLISVLTDQVVDSAHIRDPRSVSIRCTGSDECWIAEQAIETELRNGKFSTQPDSASRQSGSIHLEFLPVLRTEYGDPIESGLFGVRSITRRISVEISYKAIQPATGETIATGAVSRTAQDTVAVDLLPSLEQPGVRATQGKAPEGSLINRLVEPFVIIGSVGIMVFLLFHVRS